MIIAVKNSNSTIERHSNKNNISNNDINSISNVSNNNNNRYSNIKDNNNNKKANSN